MLVQILLANLCINANLRRHLQLLSLLSNMQIQQLTAAFVLPVLNVTYQLTAAFVLPVLNVTYQLTAAFVLAVLNVTYLSAVLISHFTINKSNEDCI